ncbi:BON domain-containing protein [Herbaspirillum sp. RTI4]|uniref:BON domain-containing protein n=1 Tax=Herbaspirillum sp. RTI4 TaxID=3048640 RepID=UPI003A0FEAF9
MKVNVPTASRVNRLKRPLATLAICGMLGLGLQGCFGVLAGGALVGAFSASDRRTVGAQTEDKGIIIKGESRIPGVVAAGSHVNVTSYNRKVLLTGEVPDEKSKQAAAAETRDIPNVQGVFNELQISGASSFGSRSSDALITSKVLASFVDAKDVFSNAYKVVTENGVVFLLGRVTQREATRGAEIVSGVSGVQKVVTLFEIISEDDLKQNDRQSGKQAE